VANEGATLAARPHQLKLAINHHHWWRLEMQAHYAKGTFQAVRLPPQQVIGANNSASGAMLHNTPQSLNIAHMRRGGAFLFEGGKPLD
jgi:hypothetical protein